MFFIIKFIYPSINIGHPLTIGIVGRYKTDELPEYILNMIGDGLTQMSADGLPLPNLAESWQSGDNGKEWKDVKLYSGSSSARDLGEFASASRESLSGIGIDPNYFPVLWDKDIGAVVDELVPFLSKDKVER